MDVSFTEIGFGSAYSPAFTNVTNWTFFSGTVNYTLPGTPAYTSVQFTLFSTSLNTTGYVDDLTLTYSPPTGEVQTIPLTGSSLTEDFYGNYFLNMNLFSPLSFTLDIFAMDGKIISEKSYSLDSGSHQIPVHTNELNAGIYFCRVVGDAIDKSFKFIK
jgi:hypothetical protein